MKSHLLFFFSIKQKMNQQNKPKKFTFGFPSKKNTPKQEEEPVEGKRKTEEVVEGSNKKLKPIEDEDELFASAGLGMKFSLLQKACFSYQFVLAPLSRKEEENKSEDEEDPLDAFMADISEKAKSEKSEPKVIGSSSSTAKKKKKKKNKLILYKDSKR